MAEPTGLRSFLVIPARLASTRLPRKLLLAETGPRRGDVNARYADSRSRQTG